VKQRLGQQRMLALFAAGLLGFNFPLLALWDVDTTLFGVPLFPAALFLVWALLIAVLGFISERIAD
jgi:fatty acid desaturase